LSSEEKSYNFLPTIIKDEKMNKRLLNLLAVVLLMSGCSWGTALNSQPDKTDVTAEAPAEVNYYLWQAGMAKMSKMPLKRVDRKNGVIVSDWMVVNGIPDEKFQIFLSVSGSELRADSLKVQVSKMNRIDGQWVKTVPDSRLAGEIEKIILQQASELYRRAAVTGEE